MNQADQLHLEASMGSTQGLGNMIHLKWTSFNLKQDSWLDTAKRRLWMDDKPITEGFPSCRFQEICKKGNHAVTCSGHYSIHQGTIKSKTWLAKHAALQDSKLFFKTVATWSTAAALVISAWSSGVLARIYWLIAQLLTQPLKSITEIFSCTERSRGQQQLATKKENLPDIPV